jgi:hypothetical protein
VFLLKAAVTSAWQWQDLRLSFLLGSAASARSLFLIFLLLIREFCSNDHEAGKLKNVGVK